MYPLPGENYNPYRLPITFKFSVSDYLLLTSEQKRQFRIFGKGTTMPGYDIINYDNPAIEHEKKLDQIYLMLMSFDGTAKTALQKQNEALDKAYKAGERIGKIHAHIKEKYGHMERSPHGHSWPSFYQRAVKRRADVMNEVYREHFFKYNKYYLDRIGLI